MKQTLTLILLVFAVLIGCKENTTPSRVNKRVKEGPWRIGKFKDSTVNRTEHYKGAIFDFTEENELIFLSASLDTFDGAWEVPSKESKPATLILRLPTEDSLPARLSDDWHVVFISKDEFRIERLNGKLHESDECFFRRIGADN